MKNQKKDWVKKLHTSHGLPKVVKLKGKQAKKWGEGMMVVPAPIEVAEIMRKVPKSKLITINEIRKLLAKKHKADITCPITTGIFSWIASYAAEQEKSQGKKHITPFWRTLKTGGELNPKYPGGIEQQKKLLEQEGHRVVQKGKKYLVANYQKTLIGSF